MIDLELIQKKVKVNDLWSKVDFPPMLEQFFDLDSGELLDEKITGLTALKEGKTGDEIHGLYDVLELYPGDGTRWD